MNFNFPIGKSASEDIISQLARDEYCDGVSGREDLVRKLAEDILDLRLRVFYFQSIKGISVPDEERTDFSDKKSGNRYCISCSVDNSVQTFDTSDGWEFSKDENTYVFEHKPKGVSFIYPKSHTTICKTEYIKSVS
jgi:hypothetical protein